MTKTTKRSGFKTALLIFFILIVIVAVVGLIVRFTKGTDPPVIDKEFTIELNDLSVENGASVGLLGSGQYFAVEGVSKYDVKVFVYCTQENDFALTVGDEPYTWGDFDGRNVTAGFDFVRNEKGFTLIHYGLNEIISRNQNGMTVKADEFPPVDIFRMTVTAGDKSVEMYFRVNAMVGGIEIDYGAIVF